MKKELFSHLHPPPPSQAWRKIKSVMRGHHALPIASRSVTADLFRFKNFTSFIRALFYCAFAKINITLTTA